MGAPQKSRLRIVAAAKLASTAEVPNGQNSVTSQQKNVSCLSPAQLQLLLVNYKHKGSVCLMASKNESVYAIINFSLLKTQH